MLKAICIIVVYLIILVLVIGPILYKNYKTKKALIADIRKRGRRIKIERT